MTPVTNITSVVVGLVPGVRTLNTTAHQLTADSQGWSGPEWTSEIRDQEWPVVRQWRGQGLSHCHNTDKGQHRALWGIRVTNCDKKWHTETRRLSSSQPLSAVTLCLCRKFGQSIDYFPVVLWIISRIRYTTTHQGWFSGFSQNIFCRCSMFSYNLGIKFAQNCFCLNKSES